MKIIKVKSCSDCSYLDVAVLHSLYCKLLGKVIWPIENEDFSAMRDVYKNCPLEDYREESK